MSFLLSLSAGARRYFFTATKSISGSEFRCRRRRVIINWSCGFLKLNLRAPARISWRAWRDLFHNASAVADCETAESPTNSSADDYGMDCLTVDLFHWYVQLVELKLPTH